MDTKGWDYVYACSTKRINKQFKKYMSNNEISFTADTDRYSVSGIFDPWTITGGSDKLLRFKTPIKSGKITSKVPGNSLEIHISGAIPEMELQLAFITDEPDSTIQNLKFNCHIKGNNEGDTTEGAVTVFNKDTSNTITDDLELAILDDCLEQIFIQNQDKLSYIFAEVDLNPGSGTSWLVPGMVQYMYYSSEGNNDVLCILGITERRYIWNRIPQSDKDKIPQENPIPSEDFSQLPREIDGELLDENHDFFMIISDGLFLEKFVLPNIESAFGGDFQYVMVSHTSGYISTTDSEISFPQFYFNTHGISQGGLYLECTPTGSINLNLDYNAIDIQVNALLTYNHPLLAGGDSSCTIEMKNLGTYDSESNTFIFSKDTNPIKTTSNDYAYEATDKLYETAFNDISIQTEPILSVIKWNNDTNISIEDFGISQCLYLRGIYEDSDTDGGNSPIDEGNSTIDRINHEIKSSDLSPKTFYYDAAMTNISGNWDIWEVIHMDGKNIKISCPIKSGTYATDYESYEFVGLEYINISLNLDDFKQSEIRPNLDEYGNYQEYIYEYSFPALDEDNQELCRDTFNGWVVNNLYKIKRVLTPLLKIDKANDEIKSENLSPTDFESFKISFPMLNGITGSWNTWKILSIDDNNIKIQCPIKSGNLSSEYFFSDKDYINISLNLENFNKDPLNKDIVSIYEYKFSFEQNLTPEEKLNIHMCIDHFRDWINNNLDKIKRVLQPLLNSDIDNANNEIKSQNLSPETFDIEINATGSSITGDWNTWNIISSDGENVRLKCPIKLGNYTHGKVYEFTGNEYINISLNLEDFRQSEINPSTDYIYKYDFGSIGSENPDDIDDSDNTKLCKGLFELWIENNLDQVKKVLQPLL